MSAEAVRMDEAEQKIRIKAVMGGAMAASRNQYFFREKLLTDLAEMFSVKGPCTVLWTNRFFSEIRSRKKGRCKDFIHINIDWSTQWLLPIWKLYIKKSDSVIEQAMYEKGGKSPVGVVTFSELYQDAGWRKRWMGSLTRSLAVAAKVNDMAYLWLRLADDDLWVFCLRRKRYEPHFTPADCAALRNFGEELLRLRKYWYLTELNKLTQQQQKIFSMYCGGMKEKLIAEALGIRPRTVENCIESVKNKIDAVQARALRDDSLLFTSEELRMLTKKEKLVLRLHSQGKDTRQIAQELSISVNTVNVHKQHIIKKFEVKNMREALTKLEAMFNWAGVEGVE